MAKLLLVALKFIGDVYYLLINSHGKGLVK